MKKHYYKIKPLTNEANTTESYEGPDPTVTIE